MSGTKESSAIALPTFDGQRHLYLIWKMAIIQKAHLHEVVPGCIVDQVLHLAEYELTQLFKDHGEYIELVKPVQPTKEEAIATPILWSMYVEENAQYKTVSDNTRSFRIALWDCLSSSVQSHLAGPKHNAQACNLSIKDIMYGIEAKYGSLSVSPQDQRHRLHSCCRRLWHQISATRRFGPSA